jgi:hypothetical protein
MKTSKHSYDITTGAGQKRMMYESVGYKVEQIIVDLYAPGDYGADPVGDGTFRMVPSGDIVDLAGRNRRLRR